MRLRVRSVLLRLIAGGVIGIGLAFVPLAQYTCALVLWPESPLLVQRPAGDGEPLPVALQWSDLTYRILIGVGSMPLAGALAVYIALASAACYVVLRAMNASFRLTTGVDWDRWLLFRTYMHTAPVIKVIVTALPGLVAAFAIWSLLRLGLPHRSWDPWLGGVVFGCVGWLLLSRDGVIGDCDSGNYQLPSARQAVMIGLRGALFGVSVVAVIGTLMAVEPQVLLRIAAEMGGLGERTWRPGAITWLVAGGLAGICLVGIALILGGARGAVRDMVAAGLVCSVYAALIGGWVPTYIREHYDYDLSTGKRVPEWWPQVSETASVPTNTWLALADRKGAWTLRPIRMQATNGTDLRPDTPDRIARFLERRRYRTALAREGATALYEHACIELDARGRLDVAATMVRKTGDLGFSRTLLEDLTALSGSRIAGEYLRLFGDRSVYAYPTDDCRLPVGDLLARHGDTAGARTWYSLAGLPESRAIERVGRLVLAAKGEVTGSVAVEAHGWEVQAALVPSTGRLATLWGRQTMPSSIWPPELREIVRSARPDAEGRFRISDVPPGQYTVAVWLRSGQPVGVPRIAIEAGETALAAIQSDGLTQRSIGALRVTVQSPKP